MIDYHDPHDQHEVDRILSLSGAALDAELRRMGIDPNQALRDFDEAMEKALRAFALTSAKETGATK